MEAEKKSEDEDYSLIELSPHETLVEFQDKSTADPNNWSFVSSAHPPEIYTCMFKAPKLTNPSVLEQKALQCNRRPHRRA